MSNHKIQQAITEGEKSTMKIWYASGIALAGVVLTVVFDFLTIGFFEPSRLQELRLDNSKFIQFLAVPFDLWIVAFALLLSASFTLDSSKQQALRPAWIGMVVGLLGVLASVVMYVVFPNNFWKIVVPDLVAGALIAYTVYVVGKAK